MVAIALHGVLLVAALTAHFELPRPPPTRIPVQLLSEPATTPTERPPALPPARLVVPAPVVVSDSAPTVDFPAAIEESPAPPAAMTSSVPAAPSASPASENLIADLSLQCPERAAPRYPPLARRQHEQGEVVLRVELDESGRVENVAVLRSSGSGRLDEAARTAVAAWHCRPAQRQGQPVRAVALQTLAFVLDRR